ncbi:MAG: FAD-dependent oxidoreductase [Chloroflexi bacterium]|nr:FAD-dependent oxidoreductase [Chloroflexota bacterium]MBI3931165.1 FAD-dependent oxidoreductase [Chloroflexota bacterium]
MYDLMILGGGPAGLAASVYAARKRLNALLISVDIGGQVNLTLGIENYLGYQFIEGPELIDKFQTQVSQYPLEQKIGYKISRLEKIEGGFEAITETGEKYQAKVALLATGKRPRQLNVPGEAELTGRGVTYCAICDGPVFSGQKVAIVGGGNSALEAVLDMVKIAEHIDLVSLTPLTGDAVLIDKLGEAKNLSIFTEYQTEKIEGRDLVEGVLIKNLKSGKEKRLNVSGVFIEIGLVPNSELVKGLVELNQWGEVVINCSCETSIPGLYAAGDVTNVPEKQIVVAAGEGAKAVLQAHRYLQRLAG